jgi:hypothetical protein
MEALFTVELPHVGQVPAGDVIAQMTDVLVLGAEREAPDPRVDAVRADHEVELLRWSVVKRDVDALRSLVQGRDRVAEAVFDPLEAVVVEQPGQIRALDLQVSAGKLARACSEPSRRSHRRTAQGGRRSAAVLAGAAASTSSAGRWSSRKLNGRRGSSQLVSPRGITQRDTARACEKVTHPDPAHPPPHQLPPAVGDFGSRYASPSVIVTGTDAPRRSARNKTQACSTTC